MTWPGWPAWPPEESAPPSPCPYCNAVKTRNTNPFLCDECASRIWTTRKRFFTPTKLNFLQEVPK